LKPACLIPWISLWPTPDGNVFPCCASTNQISNIGHLKESSLYEISQSEQMNSLRKKFMSGDLDSEVCASCIKREDIQGYSMRMMIDKNFSHLSNELVSQTKSSGEFKNFKLRFLDFVWSNKCNFKCSHCKPKFSSSLASDKSLNQFYNYSTNNLVDISQVSTNTLPEVLSLIDEVELIHFNGGEPFIIDQHFEILDHLIKLKKTDARLWFHTNGSNINYKKSKILYYLKKFPNCNISVSHDGFGKVGEFVRFGYDDSKFLKNFRELKKVCKYVYPSLCIHALNIFHIPDLIDWYQNEGLISDQLNPSINVVTAPDYINFNIHDNETKLLAREKFKKWYNHPGNKSNQYIKNKLNKIYESLSGDIGPGADKLNEYLAIKLESFKQDPNIYLPELSNFFKKLRRKNEA